MRSSRALVIFALATGVLLGAAPAAGPEKAGSLSPQVPNVTRVFYLQGMEPREAATLLRSRVQVRRVAMIGGRNAIVVSDVADRVDRSETLLRQRDAVVRATDPHRPLEPGHAADREAESRVFRVDGDGMSDVVTVLRAIYQLRDVSESPEDRSVTVSGAKPVLDSSEALLRELRLLAIPAGVAGSS